MTCRQEARNPAIGTFPFRRMSALCRAVVRMICAAAGLQQSIAELKHCDFFSTALRAMLQRDSQTPTNGANAQTTSATPDTTTPDLIPALIGWRRWIFRLTRPYVLMPAGQAFIIDRAKSSCGVGVVQMLNSHWPRTSPAEHVRECYPPKIISQFHPPPLLALRG